MPKDIRVAIVDDHPLIREVMSAVFTGQPGFVLVGTASEAPEAIAMAQRLKPDVLMLDFHLPNASARETIQKLASVAPDTRILILTSSTEDQDVRTAVVSGVHGYLTKHAERDEILEAVRAVAGGEVWLDRTAQRALGIAAYPDPKVP